MFVTIGIGTYQQDKRFLHIDGQHFIYVCDSGMGKLAAIELFRYATGDKEVQMMQPLNREIMIHRQHVAIEIDERYVEFERDRMSYQIKKAVKTAIQEKAAAFVHTDPNVRKFAVALKEIDQIAKEDIQNMRYQLTR